MFIIKNAIRQTTTETTEPIGAAAPIGKSVSGNLTDASQASGMRAVKIEITLWMKEIPLRLQAQKYPLKTK